MSFYKRSDFEFYQKLEQAFVYFDTNKNGKISRNEFGSVLEWLDLPSYPTQAKLDQAFLMVFYLVFFINISNMIFIQRS